MSLRFPTSASLGRRTSASVVLRGVAFALLGSASLAIAAHVAVPFWPVPLTLQTLAVFLLGAFAGPMVAAGAVLSYWAEGALGLPVFAQGAGIAMFVGPTGGYLLGYLPAAIVAGYAVHRTPGMLGLLRTVATLLVADALVMSLGVAWLATLIGWERAVAGGLMPFLLGEVLKVALATVAIQLRAAPVRGRR